MTNSAHILLAEDESVIASIMQEILETSDCVIDVCSDGVAAWEHLQQDQLGYDVILLDYQMPRMDGMELLRTIKHDARYAAIPVIMVTGNNDHDSIREGLHEGACYYLTKPFQPQVLRAVVQAALQQTRERQDLIASVRRAERPLVFLKSGTFHFRDLEAGRLLANYLARACPEPERVIQGLQDLLVNAVEHGNLEISYADKSQLIREDRWQQEVDHRLQLPQYKDRYVEIQFLRQPDFLQFTIVDQGAGFNWQNYLDFSPERAFDLHGRGIAMARKLSFDTLVYQGIGNAVIASVRRHNTDQRVL
jgi:DNA-binding response OmpR family regulator